MIKVYTTDELNALADFYGSKLGRSATAKTAAYIAEIMPTIQKKILEASQSTAK